MSSTETTQRRRQLPRHCVVAGLISVGIACQSELGPFFPRDWGLITLDHQMVNGNDHTRPQALFYSSVSSPTLSGRGTSDVCGRFQYPSPPSAESIEEIPAGESVTLTMQGTAYSLFPTTIGTREAYSLPEPGISYRPGDSVDVHVPGAAGGFPEMTIDGRTAEAFALGSIDGTSTANDVVTWTPAGDDSSRMVMSMQYHDASRPEPGLNTQVFCTFRDDGAGMVSTTLLREWAASTARRAQAVRWRSAVATEADAVLYLVSTYTVIKTSFP
jgi:hypothetical protein